MKEQKAILRMIIRLPFPPGLGVEWVGDSDTSFGCLGVWYATDPVPHKKETFETWIYM